MNFSNNTFTKWLIGALVFMNLFLLFAFFSSNSRHDKDQNERRHGEKGLTFLKNELNLSEDQAVKFKELRKGHFSERKEHYKSIRSLREKMMDAISSETPDLEKAKNLANQIGELEAEKELMLINHYMDLQIECTPEQREKLTLVFKKAMRRHKFHKKRRGDRKRDAE